MDVRGIGETAVYVTDIDESEHWYNNILGLDTAFRGEHYCFLNTTPDTAARQHIILFNPEYTRNQEIPPSHGTYHRTHLALDIAQTDLEDWRTRLNQHDIDVEHEQAWGNGDHSLYLRDPDDNSIELYAVE